MATKCDVQGFFITIFMFSLFSSILIFISYVSLDFITIQFFPSKRQDFEYYCFDKITEKDINASDYIKDLDIVKLFFKDDTYYLKNKVWYVMSGLKAKKQYKLTKLYEALQKKEEIRNSIINREK